MFDEADYSVPYEIYLLYVDVMVGMTRRYQPTPMSLFSDVTKKQHLRLRLVGHVSCTKNHEYCCWIYLGAQWQKHAGDRRGMNVFQWSLKFVKGC